MSNLDKTANYVIKRLKEEGIIIHRYNAYSTNSIYLKLDYGALHSIRISDHKGYDHLSYKYNITSGCTHCGWTKDNKSNWRYYCSLNKDKVDQLIEMIVANKNRAKMLYDYNEMIERYKKDAINSRGFWTKAKEV